jgi:hypothetical protein
MVATETRDSLPSLPADMPPKAVHQTVQAFIDSGEHPGMIVTLPQVEYRHAIRAIRRDGFWICKDVVGPPTSRFTRQGLCCKCWSLRGRLGGRTTARRLEW